MKDVLESTKEERLRTVLSGRVRKKDDLSGVENPFEGSSGEFGPLVDIIGEWVGSVWFTFFRSGGMGR